MGSPAGSALPGSAVRCFVRRIRHQPSLPRSVFASASHLPP